MSSTSSSCTGNIKHKLGKEVFVCIVKAANQLDRSRFETIAEWQVFYHKNVLCDQRVFARMDALNVNQFASRVHYTIEECSSRNNDQLSSNSTPFELKVIKVMPGKSALLVCDRAKYVPFSVNCLIRLFICSTLTNSVLFRWSRVFNDSLTFRISPLKRKQSKPSRFEYDHFNNLYIHRIGQADLEYTFSCDSPSDNQSRSVRSVYRLKFEYNDTVLTFSFDDLSTILIASIFVLLALFILLSPSPREYI